MVVASDLHLRDVILNVDGNVGQKLCSKMVEINYNMKQSSPKSNHYPYYLSI
jgi:hypothetical protein